MPKAENKKVAAKRGPTPAQHLTELVKAAVDAVAERRAASPAEVFCLRPVNPVRIVAAFSGGRDSTALVDILAKLYHKPHQTQIAEITVVHVHHGLSVNADAWAEHAKAMCEKWRLPLRIEKVYVNRQSPAGIEAAAREARYHTLKRIAHETNSDVIMTGHHLDDRIETFFIQWMRGAGPEGLSA
ncbi:tRNA lysidine(34) synthetase TilS, partial [Duodenibacillus massiliensis]|uniref:tRNA lysidine(34) synthetase TilS n=1 Tax=Duodenibacillus massiliensis TaxID=1852381 RepID=UPI0030768A7E